MAHAGNPRQRRAPQAALGAMCAGVVLLVVGTFLPWLTSGQVQRNSFAAGAAVRTLLDVHGAAGTALRVWPGVVAVAALTLALVALGLPRSAAALATVAALVAGAVSIAVLTRPSHGLVRLARTGPVVTLLGSVLTWAAVAGYFLVQDRNRRRAL